MNLLQKKKISMLDYKKNVKKRFIFYNDYLSYFLANKLGLNFDIVTKNNYSKYIKVLKDFFVNIKVKNLKAEYFNLFLSNIESLNIKYRYRLIINDTIKELYILSLIKEDFTLRIVKEKKQKKERIKVFTLEEINIICEYLKIRNNDLYNLFNFLLKTGLRISEALAIKKNDFKNNHILINKQFTRQNDIKFSTKTSAGVRYVPFFDTLLNLNNFKENSFLFVNKYHNYYYSFKHYLKQLNIVFSLHKCRHTFISICHALNIPAIYIKNWVGHSNIDITLNTYTHLINLDVKCDVVDYIKKLKEKYVN